MSAGYHLWTKLKSI